MARAHRIGQTKAVRVYRLLTAKTYEMHMFHSASMKLGLERAVLSQQREQSEEGEAGKSKTKSDREAQAKEIDWLLKKGAYDVFKEDDDDEAQKFMETDIDQLLESNAQTVTYGKNESNSNGGLGSFSKASFVTDTGDGEKDVDLDDPDFWRKTAGLEAPVETPEEVAQMLDDGVKRSRKQVQVFDPFADFAKIEKAKEDKKMQKIREEKEEKERLRVEKRMKKVMDKERRKKEKQEMRGSLFGKSKVPVARTKPEVKFKLKKKTALPLPTSKNLPKEKLVVKQEPIKEIKANKPKKSGERKRALRRASYEDPELERLKQAWDVPQRNRAISACLRFGFHRFCKIRAEANLTSLPIQDIEVFYRSYFYQLSLQLVVAVLQMLSDERSIFNEANIKLFIGECLGVQGSKELDWLCDCVSNGMKYYLEIENQRRFFRLPLVLSEPGFVSELRRGAALRSLRRLFILSRVDRIIEDCLDDILSELGYEQLGKRGCPTSNFSSMDVDLKARLVSTEELSLCVSAHLKKVDLRAPVAWWDRSCDVALLIGTFVHGLGNYEAMLGDESLPLSFKIRQFAKSDEACTAAQKNFLSVAKATSKVFHDALEAAKIKDQLQIQAAVAAAAATSSKREKDALALREGGEAADAVSTAVHDTPADKLYEIDGDDSHFVTLPRLRKVLRDSIRCEQTSAIPDLETVLTSAPISNNDDAILAEEKSGRKRGNSQQALAMPDARILDVRLSNILSEIEQNAYSWEDSSTELDKQPLVSHWPQSDIVSTNNNIKKRALMLVFGPPEESFDQFEVLGIGIHGMQSGSSHRSLDDGSDYFLGSASYDLSQIAYGSDAPRYLRAICVPMNMTRFAVSALVHADRTCVERLLEVEKERSTSVTNCSVEKKPAEDKGSKQSELPVNIPSSTSVTSMEKEPQASFSMVHETKNGAGIPIEVQAEAPASSGEASPVQTDAALPESLAKSIPLVPTIFEVSSKLRSSICAVLLYYGFPFKQGEDMGVSKTLWQSILDHCSIFDELAADDLFDAQRFLALVKDIAGDIGEVPGFDAIKEYVFNYLLPHCLRLCLMGNGPTLENARGSKGEYLTALGISLYPEPTENRQCDLPDPCLPLEDHSVEAVANAYAILRRTQLMRCVTQLATGQIPMEKMDVALRSAFMCKSMAGLPVWWCPWIHDAALLVHAATRGLFAIIQDRRAGNTTPLAFSREKITMHMQSTFISDDSTLPRAVVHTVAEETEKWIEHHARNFPTACVLERRLAFLCARATETLPDGEARYDNLPMFDHGAWPRN